MNEMEYRFENAVGRHLGTVKAPNEDVAKTAFFLKYCAEHNIDPRNEEHKNAVRGLINWDRVVCINTTLNPRQQAQ